MKRRPHMLGLVLVAAAAAIGAIGTSCKIQGRPQPYQAIGADAETLRAAFNADAGKVRLIVLVAPT